jgi:3-oxoacyl-[acyl-carrier protein] reductase
MTLAGTDPASPSPDTRPVALVTGVSRSAGIGAAVVDDLARAGWDIAMTYWPAYDDRMPWRSNPDDFVAIEKALHGHGARTFAVEADLAQPHVMAGVFDAVEQHLAPATALVLVHCESVDSAIRTTTLESFDRHMAVNARAPWLLIREFANRYKAEYGRGRIVALTSDHTAGNLPYGASKGALDRIVLASARELADLGVTANVINPGPTDTGWMNEEQLRSVAKATPLGRVGQPADAAHLVTFLCSPAGGWINGQLIHSDGGFTA